MKRWLSVVVVLSMILGMTGCATTSEEALEQEIEEVVEAEVALEEESEGTPLVIEVIEPEAAEEAEVAETGDSLNQEAEEATQESEDVFIVAIDAGHQAQGNSDQEPIGPGASETKAKVSSGTAGVSSGVAEYELTLEIALKLETALLAQGYQVVMIRSTNDVDISNAERAAIANEANADVFIRIHANGSSDSSVTGAMTICPTSSNPYCSEIYTESKLLSTLVLDSYVEATGCKEQYVWETDTMSGINWCEVPVTIIEMGYMSNAAEDELMQTDEYQEKMVTGMVNGIMAYAETL